MIPKPNPSASVSQQQLLRYLKWSSPARPLVAASSGNSSSGGFPLWDEYAFKESTSSDRLPLTPSSMNPRDQQMKPGALFRAGCKGKQESERTLACPVLLPSATSHRTMGNKASAYQQRCLLGQRRSLLAKGTIAENTLLPGPKSSGV